MSAHSMNWPHFIVMYYSDTILIRMLLKHHVKSLGREPSTAQRNTLLERRRKLEAYISNYVHHMTVLMKVDEDIKWSHRVDKSPDMDLRDDDEWVNDYPDGIIIPESSLVPLPLALAPGEIDHLALTSLAQVEIELWVGQVSEALDNLRLALGEKSLAFRMDVHNAHSQHTISRSWDNVHRYDEHAQLEKDRYHLACTALQSYSADEEYLRSLQDITDDDLKVSSDLTDERRFGQRSDVLLWFWGFGPEGGLGQGSERLRECMKL